MATDIGPKVGIQGEKSFISALKAMDAQLKVLRREMKAVTSEFDKNDKSIENLSKQNSVYAKRAEELRKAVSLCEDRISKLSAEFGENSKEVVTAKDALYKYLSQLNNVNREMRNNEQTIDAYKQTMVSSSDAVADGDQRLEQSRAALERLRSTYAGTTPSVENLERQIQLLNEQQGLLTNRQAAAAAALDAAESAYGSNSDEAKRWREQLERSDSALSGVQGEISATTERLAALESGFRKTESAAQTLDSIIGLAGLTKTIRFAYNMLKSLSVAATEFETAITGVYKTVDGTDAQLSALSDDVKDLATEIPVASTEIAKVAEIAGQLGIATEDIVAFTKVMLALGVSTNISAEEASSALAKFANITKMSSDDYERLGSSIVALGNNFATTEADIVDMATRIASTGTLVGLTESQILALATAISSVGISAEMGGTAMAKTLANIESAVARGDESLQNFADVAGMSAEQFAASWESDPIAALEAFIRGLGSLEDRGENATLVLDEMGLSAIRQSNMLKSLSLASDKLTEAVSLGTTAWEENVALSVESGRFYGTTESSLKKLSNSFDNLKIAIGNGFNPALQNGSEILTNVISNVTEFAEENAWLGQTIGALASAVAGFASVLTAYIAVSKAAKIVTDLFNASMKANVVFAVASAVAALAAGLVVFLSNADNATASVKDLTESSRALEETIETTNETLHNSSAEVEAAAATAGRYIDRLNELEKAGTANNDAQDEYLATVEMLKSVLPDVSIEIDEQTGLIKDSAASLYKIVDAWKEAALAEARYTAYKEQIDAYAKAELEYQTNLAKRAEKQRELNALLAELLALQSLVQAAQLGASFSADQTALFEQYGNNWIAVEDAMHSVSVQYYATLSELGTLDSAILSSEETLSGFDETIFYTEEALNGLASAETTAANAVATSTQSLDGISSTMKAIAADFATTKDAILANVKNLFDGFNSVEITQDFGISGMNDALDSQSSFMDEYIGNLEQLDSWELDPSFIAQFADGTAESAAYLDAIVKGGQDAAIALQEKWQQNQETLDEFSEALTYYYGEFETKLEDLDELVEESAENMDKSSETRQAAIDTIQGYINGLSNKSGSLYSKMSEIARNALSYFNVGLQGTRSTYYYGDRGSSSRSTAALNGVAQIIGERASVALYDGLSSSLRAYDLQSFAANAGRMTPSLILPDNSLHDVAAGVVNGVSTAMAGVGMPENATIVLKMGDGMEMARWILPDLRAAMSADPEVVY